MNVNVVPDLPEDYSRELPASRDEVMMKAWDYLVRISVDMIP